MNRRVLFASITVVAVFTTVLVLLYPRSTKAEPPDDFLPWIEHIQTFETLYATVATPMGRYILRADGEGLVTFDSELPEGRGRVRFRPGEQATFQGPWPGLDRALVHTDPLLDRIAHELWAELRSGLANSTWTDTNPVRDGFIVFDDPNREMPPNEAWARVDLPFQWSAGWSFYVMLKKGTTQLRMIQVIDLANAKLGDPFVSMPHHLGTSWSWNVPLGPDRDSLFYPEDQLLNLLVFPRADRTDPLNPYHVLVERSIQDPGPGHSHNEPEYLGPGHDHGYGFPSGHTHGHAPPPPTCSAYPCGSNKLNICHKPQQARNTLCLPTNAIQAHLGHGDICGPCD